MKQLKHYLPLFDLEKEGLAVYEKKEI